MAKHPYPVPALLSSSKCVSGLSPRRPMGVWGAGEAVTVTGMLIKAVGMTVVMFSKYCKFTSSWVSFYFSFINGKSFFLTERVTQDFGVCFGREGWVLTLPPNLGCIMYFSLIFFYGVSPCREGEGLGSAFSVPPVWLSGARGASKPELPPGAAPCWGARPSQSGAKHQAPPERDVQQGLEEKQSRWRVPEGCWLKWWLGSQQRAGCCIALRAL